MNKNTVKTLVACGDSLDYAAKELDRITAKFIEVTPGVFRDLRDSLAYDVDEGTFHVMRSIVYEPEVTFSSEIKVTS